MNESGKNPNQQSYWQEMGRWAGYEETYDVEAGRWGPSHISYLTFKSLVQIRRTMNTGLIMLDREEKTLSGVIEKVVDALVSKKDIQPGDRDKVLQALMHKQSQSVETQPLTSGMEMEKFSVTEKSDTTGTAEASMVLVGALEFLERPTIAFVRLRDAVVLESALETPVPVRFIFILIGPTTTDMDYHECGRAMAALLADKVFNQAAFQAQSDRELTDALGDFMDCCIVIPPTEIQDESMLTSLIPFQKKLLQERLRPSDPKLRLDVKPRKPSKSSGPPPEDPLARTGVPFGGMIRDMKRRYQYYVSDITDALNAQVVAAIIFIYFAALSPAITFGGLLADKVDNMMGVSELMISTSVLGIIFCLIAAQPVLVIGFSGPLLVFEEAFFNVFKEHPLILNYEHLNTTAEDPWHSVVSYQRLLDNATGNMSVVRSITHQPYPNTALLSMCLMFGCFSIAYYLRMFKNGKFLPGKIRRLLGDFGVPIAIFLMVAIDINIEDTYTQKLVVPKGLQVSNPKMRGWLINPMGEHKPFPIWMMFASVVPAMLVFILIFLESQITTLIVSKPERKMVKGSGFHMDLLILVSMGGLSAIFGIPWLSAATVRSVSHANALTVMSKGPKPEIEKVLEQRVSGVVVALLVGLSILMEPILKMIPITALFGIFLYMGITSLSGIQLWDRMLLLLIPKKYHPNEPYATKVSTNRMHVFTAIQMVCLAALWMVKSSPVSLALPFILILTIPLRMFMTGRLFTEQEMKYLDGDDAKATFEEEPGVDVYSETQMPL
ncbi:solute carrier family 4 member 1b (Diego blood group) isoform X2 [Puntigrus tetrazona]|uniref:solute carrier family 4 member 1b (Diego blood group) isoform X2 n=1 Tax=Puntigrus tetrazona TaxID=1606681 RepID=UPI001C891575|nr:solute carrier family 4 member 1b (Diego blood group) isoform X2 [Puntigrus tetrazona]